MFKARVRSKFGRSNRIAKIPDVVQRLRSGDLGAVGVWDINRCTIRVREDSGNTERDFQPIARKIDTVSIAAFVGANSGYITKIYDYTGNGNDATQTTAANQPRLINAGVFEVDSNGDIAMYFDGINDYLSVSAGEELNIVSGGLTLLAKCDPDSVATSYIFIRNVNTAGEAQYGLQFSNTSSAGFGVRLNDGVKADENNSSLGVRIFISTYDDVNVKTYRNGLFVESASYSTNLTSRTPFLIGARSDNADGSLQTLYYIGHMTNLGVFNKALTQNEVTLLTNRI